MCHCSNPCPPLLRLQMFAEECTAVCNQGCYHGFGAAFVRLLASRSCADGGSVGALYCIEDHKLLRTICDHVNDVRAPYEIRMFACRRGLGFGVADVFDTVDDALQFCTDVELDSTCAGALYVCSASTFDVFVAPDISTAM